MFAVPTAQTQKSPIESYLHVLYALILRDIRTRFGASLWGYGVIVLWPCVHVFMLIAIYTFQKLPAPLGMSAPCSSPPARCRCWSSSTFPAR